MIFCMLYARDINAKGWEVDEQMDNEQIGCKQGSV